MIKARRLIYACAMLGLLLPLLAPAMSVESSRWQGFYLGLMPGHGWADYRSYPFPNFVKPYRVRIGGYATNIHFGYRLGGVFAFEGGVVYLTKPRVTCLDVPTCSFKFKSNLVYAVTLITWPLPLGISAFVKMGIGYVVRDQINQFSGPTMIGGAYVRPMLGAGVAWRAGRHWQLTCSWIQAMKNATANLPATHFIGAGVNYLFVSPLH